jgi:hypothetical protein
MIWMKNHLSFGFFGQMRVRSPRTDSGPKEGLEDIFDPSPYLQVDRIDLGRWAVDLKWVIAGVFVLEGRDKSRMLSDKLQLEMTRVLWAIELGLWAEARAV